MASPTRYYVRVGADVRGPVDEYVVAGWIAQGMRNADVCVEGAPAFVPLGQTHLARYLHAYSSPPPPSTSPWTKWRIGAGLILPIVLIGVRLLPLMLPHDKKELAATLPTVGVQGTLEGSAPLGLCTAGTNFWTWPCRTKKSIEPGTHVQLMKAEVKGSNALCRYWIQGGPDDRFVGDGPCALLKSP